MRKNYLSMSAAETKELAKSVLNGLENINLICLYGNLGSGKTTFVQGLAQNLGIKKTVQSPTFILQREYEINAKLKKLIHIDCYRIDSEKETEGLGLEELWRDKSNLVVVEWADRIKKFLPQKRVDIYFAYEGENERRLSIIS